MKKCENKGCNNKFPIWEKIDGKIRNYQRRKYCFICSPFGENNTKRLEKIVEDRKCFNCGNIIKNKKFCSTICQQGYYRKQRWEKIEKTGCLISRKDKKYLIEKRGHKCELCGITEWLGKPVLLLLDHIDGNSDNDGLDNVRLICSNCDATLETYKSRNKGSGRHYRRQRYANGQSY